MVCQAVSLKLGSNAFRHCANSAFLSHEANQKSMQVYVDLKSPMAYLALQPTYDVARDYKVDLDWLPYDLAISEYRGSATLDDQDNVVQQERTPRQWRVVRYQYMNARRYANLRGIIIRGTQKIWDTSLANIGMLFAKKHSLLLLHHYMEIIWPLFWQRGIDIECVSAISGVILKACEQAGLDTSDIENSFLAYACDGGSGRAKLASVVMTAEEHGVFGVPSYLLDGELFWGREHLPLIRRRLHDLGLARRPDVIPDTPFVHQC